VMHYIDRRQIGADLYFQDERRVGPPVAVSHRLAMIIAT
jgi:hypothetical protein